MKNFFSGNAWGGANGRPGGALSGMGFRPGPVEVNLVRPLTAAPSTFGGQAQMAAPQRKAEEIVYQSSPMPSPSGDIHRKPTTGNKADCPVCRKFGS